MNEFIDWVRYRKHWIDITGCSINKDGKKKTFKVNSTGEHQVVALAPNVAGVINGIANKIMSPNWIELTKNDNEPTS